MLILKRLLSIFRIRDYPDLQTISPPAYLVSGVLVASGFIFYFFSGPAFEETMRFSALGAAACAVVILLVHLLSPNLARWSASILTSALVFGLAIIWEDPVLLYLLAIPVILAAVLVNWPAAMLTAAAQTILILAAPPWPMPVGSGQAILIFLVWLAALASGGGYLLVERVLEQASRDYEQLQALLVESRGQQQKLSETLEDLEHANRQLSLLYDKNILLRKTAEEATEAKTTYIARVSHEIRTPLNMILGITESIIENHEEYEEELPLDLVDDIRVIRRNSEHLLSLVNDVLDLTRADASRLVLRKEWVDIGGEIEKSLEIVLPLARKKKLALRFVPILPLPEIYCDRTRIRQVVLNLLSNAVRYTDQGEVSVWASADDSWLTIQVKDTGPGIEAADSERIFEPFYRGATSVRQENIGTGLGLSVCRQMVELHGGKVWLESQPGHGATFAFHLPVAGGDTARSPVRFINEQWVWVERKRERAYSFRTPQKKRIVVCGRGELLSNDASGLADRAEIINVETIDALAADVDATPAHLVVINDHSLPELAIKLEKAALSIQDTPIIGSLFTSLQEQVAQAGAIDYVQKPFSNQRLREAVAQVQPYPKRILIVDDNVDVQRLMVRVLTMQSETTQYLLAENGRQALEIARRKKPDLILLDLALPEMDGWQFLACMREEISIRDIPVILVSARDLQDSPARSPAVVLMDGAGISMERFLGLVRGSLDG
jgi:signal transduction histidine kinase/CheY-like chemotaxis protein